MVDTLQNRGSRVAVVAGCRTPFVKAGGVFKRLSALDLAKAVTVELLNRTELDPAEIDEAIFATAVPWVKTPNLAREAVIRAGLPLTTPAYTVVRACASANQAIVSAAQSIVSGDSDTVLVGGAEYLSDPPVLFSRRFREALFDAYRGKSVSSRLSPFSRLRLKDLAPDPPAIAEAATGMSMGEHAERMAKENGISRRAQDEWALRSHLRAAEGFATCKLSGEVITVYPPPNFTEAVNADNGVRQDATLAALSTLPPVFDRRHGSVTAGNASPLTDGASALLLMREGKAKALGYTPMGYIRAYAFAALSPWDQLLMGPVYAAPRALDRAGLTLRDMDLVEMHEAFAAQVLSNIQGLGSKKFAEEKLGRREPVGEIDPERLNVYGGSIAIGHPFGATGGRLTVTILNELRRRNAQFGLLTVCAAGAMGFAMVLERE